VAVDLGQRSQIGRRLGYLSDELVGFSGGEVSEEITTKYGASGVYVLTRSGDACGQCGDGGSPGLKLGR
jgi:hypothetical protein